MTDKFKDVIAAIKDSNLDNDLIDLYGEAALDGQKRRYVGLLEKMGTRFAPDEAAVITSPGRTELGGNHTDHNNGQVLAAAVHLDCVAAAAPFQGMKVVIDSEGFSKLIQVDMSDFAPRAREKGRPASLVRGVAAGLNEMGFLVKGFKACVNSTVLPGSGLSSSAAFAVAIGNIFNHLFSEGAVPGKDLARIAKKAENEFFGKSCGFMDQLTCALGGVLHLDFKNPSNPVINRINVNFEKAGCQLAVVDTGESHAELTSEYDAITKEMQAVAFALGKEVLRGLSVDDIIQAVPMMRLKTGDRAILRAIHFVEDSQRVADMVAALRQNRMDAFLALVSASGNSSWRLLQNCFHKSNPQMQGVPLALALTERFLGGKGACRVHGGGFEGTIQVYIPKAELTNYRRSMERIFGQRSVTALRFRKRGVSVLRPDGLSSAL